MLSTVPVLLSRRSRQPTVTATQEAGSREAFFQLTRRTMALFSHRLFCRLRHNLYLSSQDLNQNPHGKRQQQFKAQQKRSKALGSSYAPDSSQNDRSYINCFFLQGFTLSPEQAPGSPLRSAPAQLLHGLYPFRSLIQAVPCGPQHPEILPQHPPESQSCGLSDRLSPEPFSKAPKSLWDSAQAPVRHCFWWLSQTHDIVIYLIVYKHFFRLLFSFPSVPDC